MYLYVVKIHLAKSKENHEIVSCEVQPHYRDEGFKNIKELLTTEERYIATLEQIRKFIDYIAKSKRNEPKVAPLPEGLKQGKDEFVFKNIIDIMNFHSK